MKRVRLSKRKLEILQLLKSGMTMGEVADRFGIEAKTVEWHANGVRRELAMMLPVTWDGTEFSNRSDLASIAGSRLLDFCESFNSFKKDGQMQNVQNHRMSHNEVAELMLWLQVNKARLSQKLFTPQEVITLVKNEVKADDKTPLEVNSEQVRFYMNKVGILFDMPKVPANTKMAAICDRLDKAEARTAVLEKQVAELFQLFETATAPKPSQNGVVHQKR